MPTIAVTLGCDADLCFEMARLRTWFDAKRSSPSVFRYHQDRDGVVIEANIDDPKTATDFRLAFRGREICSSGFERRFSVETMETACWWRLRAEEIRAEASEYRSRDAKKTMAEVALCYKRMADDLEKRLADARYRSGLIVG